jgi:ketosteroid isomerase-like protein
MSQENVEVATRFTDAFNRRDLNALMDTATPDIAFHPALAGTVDDNSFQGREGMRAYFADVDSAWEEFRVIVDEYRDLGDRVLGLGRVEGRGRGSGAAVDTPLGGSWTFETGRSHASARILITARRCGRRASRSSGQVPGTSAFSWMRACR